MKFEVIVLYHIPHVKEEFETHHLLNQSVFGSINSSVELKHLGGRFGESFTAKWANNEIHLFHNLYLLQMQLSELFLIP